MNPSDILLLGMKKRVTAVDKATGRIVWETKLKGGQGEFVTLLCEGARIFAAAGGHLRCLDFRTGNILWTNDLPGYGFGLASLCLPGGQTAPTAAALAAHLAEQQSASAASATVPVSTM